MTQLNLSVKQKQNHRHKEQTGSCRGKSGVGQGWSGSLGLADVSFYI